MYSYYVSAELMERLYSRSFHSSLFMSELLNHNIKRVSYELTHYRKELDLIHRARKLVTEPLDSSVYKLPVDG